MSTRSGLVGTSQESRPTTQKYQVGKRFVIHFYFLQHTIGFSLLCPPIVLPIFLRVPMGPIYQVWAPAAIHLWCTASADAGMASAPDPALDPAPVLSMGARTCSRLG